MPGKNAGVVVPKNCDPSVRLAIQQLATKVVGLESTSTFAGLTLSGLTASRLLSSDSDKALASVGDLTSWIAGTANQVVVADDSDGTITLSTPQDIHTDATPEFNDVILGDWQHSTPTYDSVHDWMNTTQSAGLISGGVISDATGGNINVTAGTGFAKSADTEIATTLFVDWVARNGIAIASGSRHTVYVDYDASPQVLVTTDPASDIDHTTAFAIGSVLYDGTDMHILNEAGTRNYNLARRSHHRARQLRGFERATGLVTGDEGTRYVSITSGTIYAGLNSISITGCDSSDPDADTFATWYYDGDLGGGADWVENTGVRQLDNVQYNAVTTGLANLTSNRYGVHWIFMDIDNHCNVLYGQGNYTLALAQGAVVPASLPPLLSDFAILIAKVIVREGQAEIIEIATAFETTFGYSVANNHNELANLQGGTTDEYYHLTSAEHTAVGALGATYQPLDDVLTDISALAVVADNEIMVGTGAGTLAWESGATARASLGVEDKYVAIDAGATPGYLGNANNDGVIRTADPIIWNDGGDYCQITLSYGSTLKKSGTALGVNTGITDDKILQVDDADAADNDYAKFTTSGIEGRSYAEVRDDLALDIGEDVQAYGAILDDLNTLGIAASDGQFIVATGEGVFAYEATTTARTSLGVGTGDSPQFTGIELGHASDTTLTRVSAGIVAIEGTNIMLVGDAPTAHTHDGDTLQLDGVNSDGGAFNFTTSGAVTFSQNLIMADGKTIGQAAGPLLAFDNTNNYLEVTGCDVGIGTTAPTADLHVSTDGVAIDAGLLSNDYIVLSRSAGTAAFSLICTGSNAWDRGVFKCIRAGGTLSSPTVPASGDNVFSLVGEIYDGVDTENTAGIEFIVDGAVSEDVCPQRISFLTSKTDSAGKGYRLTIKSDGKIGMGTTTIPHGGVGTALLALEGTDSSVTDGPYVQITNSADDYPLFQISPYSHDNFMLVFDAYVRAAGGWRSSDAGSNFAIQKRFDTIGFLYDGPVAQGSEVSWNTALTIDTSGVVDINESLTIPEIVIADGGTVGQAAGPLITFSDTNNRLVIGGLSGGLIISGANQNYNANVAIVNETLNRTVSYTGLLVSHIKTAGNTDQADDLVSGNFSMAVNHNDVCGHIYGLKCSATLTLGTVGDGQESITGLSGSATINGGTCNNDLVGGQLTAAANAGTIADDVVGLDISATTAGGLTALNGDFYGLKIYTTLGTAPAGTAYGIFLNDFNLDYAVYQNGSAPSNFNGELTAAKLHAGDGADFDGAITNLTIVDGIITAAS